MFQPIYNLSRTFLLHNQLHGPEISDFHLLIGKNCSNLKKIKKLRNIYPVLPPLKLYCLELKKLNQFSKIVEKTIEDENEKNESENKNENENENNESHSSRKIYHLNMSLLKSQDFLLRDLQRAQEILYQIRWNNKIHDNILAADNIKYIKDERILYNLSKQLEGR